MGGIKKREKQVKAENRREVRDRRNQPHSYYEDDDDCDQLNNQLLALGLALKIIPGDGNCLFRALGDQLDGDIHEHMTHRQDVVQFMLDHRDDFEPFVEDDLTFDQHMKNLLQPGTFGGNDSIVAFSRFHGLTVVIHQLNKPLWQVFSEGGNRNKELHISFHNGDHYNSVRKSGDVDNVGPANVHLARLHRQVSSHNVVSKDPLSNDQSSADEGSDYENAPNVLKLIEEVSRICNIKDRNKIISALKAHAYDTQAAVKELEKSSNVKNTDLWSQNGSGSRIIGNQILDSNDGIKVPPKKLTAKQQKELKKKQLRLEKHTVKKSDSSAEPEQDVQFNNSFKTLSI